MKQTIRHTIYSMFTIILLGVILSLAYLLIINIKEIVNLYNSPQYAVDFNYKTYITAKDDYKICDGKEKCIVGYTVKNEPIEAYVFGTGEKKYLLFGAIHGTEKNSKVIMEKFVEDLQVIKSVYDKSIQIIIIPGINPDGLASNSRFNANGVDLNRNFDTKDWQQITYLTEGQVYENGGGKEPFSEPETIVLKDLIEKLNPVLTISFHSWGNCVIPNESNLAKQKAKIYAEMTGYKYLGPEIDTSENFDYIATGTINTWGNENTHPIITVELKDMENDDYENNRKAIFSLFSTSNI